MQINSIEPIVMSPPPVFPCYACHGTNGNATHFIHAYVEGKGFTHKLKLPVCGKCAEYARVYPTWLEEMLFQRRLEAAKETMPESVPAMVAGF